MKAILKLALLFIPLVLLSSGCSSDDNTTKSEDSKLIGTWGTKWDAGEGEKVHPKFTFKADGKVKYYTYSGGANASLEEIGDWNLSGDVLTMEFKETVNTKFKNKVVFLGESGMELHEMNEAGFDSWWTELYHKTTEPQLD